MAIDSFIPSFCDFFNMNAVETLQNIWNTTEPTNEPWEHIFNELNYKGDTDIHITTKQIKQAKQSWTSSKSCQFEPRLLCYQTSSESRPDIFIKHGIYILPISNSVYYITKTSIYHPLTYHSTEEVIIQKNTSSLVLSAGSSEMSLIDNLCYSGVFERPEFMGEPIKYGSLLHGRHHCHFTMKLGQTSIRINGVQYETDGCYESEHKILIVEGKSSHKRIKSFNIRQLYFPYRVLTEHTQSKKEIIPIFIYNENNMIHIWKFAFTDLQCMDSIVTTGYYIYKYQ